MTKNEFKNNIDTQGNDIYFTLNGRKFNLGYIPVSLGNGDMGFDRIGIYEIKDEVKVKWYKDVDEMLKGYVIDGIPLGDLLDDVQDMHGTPVA
jgi:hypothetical protein